MFSPFPFLTNFVICKCFQFAKSHSSVGSFVDLRTGGYWFDPRLDQYFFLRIDDSHWDRTHPLLPLSIVLTVVVWESIQWLGKNIVQGTG